MVCLFMPGGLLKDFPEEYYNNKKNPWKGVYLKNETK